MYVHAYQSYLWNAAASHRVKTFGAERAVAGDLVVAPRSAADSDESSPDAGENVHVHSGPGPHGYDLIRNKNLSLSHSILFIACLIGIVNECLVSNVEKQ